jgi:cyclophilin family peptidyl-prolyl cis-trans isomerase/HEAT repeat protein
MKALYFYAIIAFLTIVSCHNNNADTFDNQSVDYNKFQDKEIQKIYQFQNGRQTNELISYFDHSNPAYRETAVLAFASVQDTAAIDNLFEILENDESQRVRMAAAFSIGQTGDSLAEMSLIKLSDTEESIQVKATIYEAIGKCGTLTGHDYLFQELQNYKETNNLKGLLLGLSRFSIRGIVNDSAINRIIEIISDENLSEEIRYVASVYLIRLRNWDLSTSVDKLKVSFEKCNNLYTKMNLAMAFSKAINKESLAFLTKILSDDIDYRIKINAMRSLSAFSYNEANELMFNLLNDSNVNVGIQASEYFMNKGIKQDALRYFKKAKTTMNWRVRTNLLNSAIHYSAQKTDIAATIISFYNASKNSYEKASLLRALGGDFASFKFIEKEIKEAKSLVISTAGMEALAEMRRNPGFDIYREKQKMAGKGDLGNEFALIFKDAIFSGDLAMVGIAAEIIRDPNLDFRQQYKNSYFLNQALNNCKLPAGIEIYRELQKTISFINGTEYIEQKVAPDPKIDWEFISKIPVNQLVEISTSKGKIELLLNVNLAPLSVANFLKLISIDYFKNGFFHRVVPNFVVQDGCPRGDGWGGPDYTICSEFGMINYEEGSLGMASSGKDTESGQWFITHSPTPHLDGRYTNFGKVLKGMDVVHHLEVGDTIFGMEVIKGSAQ